MNANPPACDAQRTLRDNEAALQRWRNCEQARVQQQTAFTGGLTDVQACRDAKCADYDNTVKNNLAAIEDAITAGQPNHATQLAGVRTSLNRCPPIIAAQKAQEGKAVK
jgi:hypothetical protein